MRRTRVRFIALLVAVMAMPLAIVAPPSVRAAGADSLLCPLGPEPCDIDLPPVDPPPVEPPPPVIKSSTDPAGEGGCQISVDDPHVSRRVTTEVVAKTRVKCLTQVTGVDLKMLLFRCPNQPTGPESSWDEQGCVRVNMEPATLTTPSVGTEYTRQVTAPHVANGWYVACTVWIIYRSPTDTGYYGQSQSNPRPL